MEYWIYEFYYSIINPNCLCYFTCINYFYNKSNFKHMSYSKGYMQYRLNLKWWMTN